MKAKITTIQLSTETRQKIDDLKTKYGFKSYEDCLKTIWLFLENSGLNPTLPYSNDINKLLLSRLDENHLEMLKTIKEQTQSLRKFQGAMEKNYFKPMAKKFAFSDFIKDEDFKNSVQEGENINASEKISDDIAVLKVQLKQQGKYKEMLKFLVSNIERKEYGLFGEYRLLLNMKEEDFLKLKEDIL